MYLYILYKNMCPIYFLRPPHRYLYRYIISGHTPDNRCHYRYSKYFNIVINKHLIGIKLHNGSRRLNCFFKF